MGTFSLFLGTGTDGNYGKVLVFVLTDHAVNIMSSPALHNIRDCAPKCNGTEETGQKCFWIYFKTYTFFKKIFFKCG